MVRFSLACVAVLGLSAAPAWAQLHEYGMQASDATGLSNLGRVAAISGDTFAAAAPFDDASGLTDSGSVYVWVRQGGGWLQQAKLVDSNPAQADRFGTAIALDGDTLMVGVPEDGYSGSSQRGSVTVFERQGNGTWLEQQTLTPSDTFGGDKFGSSVGIVGDLCLIGSPRDDDGGTGSSGSVYVFTRTGGTWTQQAKIHASPVSGQREFGNSLALSADGSTVVVGAWLESYDGMGQAGAAYVFAQQGGSWVQQARLTPADADPVDFFGNAVAIDGDTVVVAAYADDILGRTDAGSAYVFTRSGSTWKEQAKLTVPDPAADDLMGFSVAVRGDRAFVGLLQDDLPGIPDIGSVADFEAPDWSQTWRFSGSDSDASDGFGSALAVGEKWIVVGAQYVTAPGGGPGSIAAGAVYALREVWADLGSALAGTQGEPVLTGLGDLHAGTEAGLSLAAARPSTLTFLVAGLTTLDVPFEGGVLVPSPDVILPRLTDGSGSLEVSTIWPAGQPVDLSLAFQAWIVDPVGPFGYAASNALSGVTP